MDHERLRQLPPPARARDQHDRPLLAAQREPAPRSHVGSDTVAALDPATQERMEARFGHSFRDVRVHADPAAASRVHALNALAYTRGNDIFFAPGQYAPTTHVGDRLLAHELTHVLQQRAVGTQPAVQPPGMMDPLEAEANRAADLVRMGGTRPVITSAPSIGIQMQQRGRAPALEAVPGISTPLERVARARVGGGRTLTVNGVTVIVLPDVQSEDERLRGRAETTIQFSDYNIAAQTRGERVASFTGPGAVTATIRTTYGPGVTAASASGYGRGTTAADVAAGTTTLGFHEGRHGRDFIEFLRARPYPRFTGRRGQSAEQFQAAMDTYDAAVTQYQRDIDTFSQQRTDCVGTTIDAYLRQQGVASAICRRVP